MPKIKLCGVGSVSYTHLNLLVAGRCIDGDHYSSSAFRCMPGAMAIGQGAGVAAAVLAEDGKSTHKADVTRIQRILREQGAVIK